MLFVLSLFAEFIANDKPLIVSYKGEILFPVLVDYPEDKFGGFLAVTDYRDPVIYDEINAHGWMIWPPFRYSYRTVNNEIPEAAPAKPSWLYDKKTRCAQYEKGVGRSGLHAGQLELARHRRPGARRAGARHLRLPHIGAVRPDADRLLGAHRRVGGRGAGLFRRLDRSALPALHRDLVVDSRCST